MSENEFIAWQNANESYLMASLQEVRFLLAERAETDQESGKWASRRTQIEAVFEKNREKWPAPFALDTLCSIFKLSPFERRILLMCTGMALDPTFGSLCAAVQGDPLENYPTFDLAKTVFPEADWRAFSPAGALRDWRLLELKNPEILFSSPIIIDERILYYLLGNSYLDERLASFFRLQDRAGALLPSQETLSNRIAESLSRLAAHEAPPVIHLVGPDPVAQRALAVEISRQLELDLFQLLVQALPPESRELHALIRLWERETALSPAALFLDFSEGESIDPHQKQALFRLIDGSHGLVFSAGHTRRSYHNRPTLTVEVTKPTTEEQRILWRQTLGSSAALLNGRLDVLISQFSLKPQEIDAIGAEVLANPPIRQERRGQPEVAIKAPDPWEENTLFNLLWDTCRSQSRPHMEDLAQHLNSPVTSEDLILPVFQKQILEEIGNHVKQRTKVYDTWAFASRSSRGLGITALFAGPSGTGKTLAAEVLANTLRLDLFRIDLSQVVSKFIGETEKNLRRVFDKAEDGGGILLFDEADALFGKRSEVKDSHDRYANIEVGYLLQRMEAYRGLAILTTNMKEALDVAFLRRIRFVVQFPFPDFELRKRIWDRFFPGTDNHHGNLDTDKLSRLNIAGGNIRNIALFAAFSAAEEGSPITMKHLLHGARVEYAKLEKTLQRNETADWYEPSRPERA